MKIVFMLLFWIALNSAPVHSAVVQDVTSLIEVGHNEPGKDNKQQQRHDTTIILIQPNILTLSFNGSSSDDLLPTAFPDISTANLTLPNKSAGCITGCVAVTMDPPKAARDTADIIMVMMFSLWIVFAFAVLIFCGFCYCRRHAQNDQLFESPGFDEGLQSYVLATFAHAQRIARLIKRKEKLAELELQKTEMVREVHALLVYQ